MIVTGSIVLQLIKDLQRAVDVLRAQPNVDDERIAYHGTSYGGAMGALFVGTFVPLRRPFVREHPRFGPISLFRAHAGNDRDRKHVTSTRTIV